MPVSRWCETCTVSILCCCCICMFSVPRLSQLIAMFIVQDVHLAALPDGEFGGDVVIHGTLDVLCHPQSPPSHSLDLPKQREISQ